MKPDQLDVLTLPSAPSVNSQTGEIVFATSTPNFDTDSYVGQLYRVSPQQPQRLHRLTRGHADSSPRYSPDGTKIAFLRAPEGQAAQLFILPADGGEAWQVSERLLGVSDFSWSPDSSSIAFLSREPQPGRYGQLSGVSAAQEDPRVITTLKYSQNGLGYDLDRPRQLFAVAIDPLAPEVPYPQQGRAVGAKSNTSGVSGKPGDQGEREDRGDQPETAKPTTPHPAVRLTQDELDYTSVIFAPDGNQVYTAAASLEQRDTTLCADLVAIDVRTLDRQVLARAEPAESLSADANPMPTEDGRWLYFLRQDLGVSGNDFVAQGTQLWVLDLHSSRTRRLSDPDTDYVGSIQGAWEQDKALVITWEHARTTLQVASPEQPLMAIPLSALAPDGSKTVPINVSAAAPGPSARIAISYQSPSSAGEVGVVDLSQGEDQGLLEPLTHFGEELGARTTVSEIQEYEFRGADGYPVHGWVLKPQGEGPHPVLLNIHGGPFHAYSDSYFDEAQVYTEAGYAVVMCNPRGSASYGRQHGVAIKGKMGTVDYDDVMTFLNGALERDTQLDAQRVGIMGGSYGGYLSAWIIGHEDRFRAAIVGRGFLDPESFVGTSDIGSFFGQEYVGVDPQAIASQSPMAVIDRVSTPTFVIHAEQDLRCPLEQGQRYYAGLKARGVPAKLMVFPGENHELSRSGTPWHRRRRFEEILAWWDEYLPVEGKSAD